MSNRLTTMARRKNKLPPVPVKNFPGWRYGPEGQSAIFQNEDEVPEGWVRDRKEAAPALEASAKADAKIGEDPYKGRDSASIIAELKAKKLDFNEKWPLDKLIGILKATEKR